MSRQIIRQEIIPGYYRELLGIVIAQCPLEKAKIRRINEDLYSKYPQMPSQAFAMRFCLPDEPSESLDLKILCSDSSARLKEGLFYRWYAKLADTLYQRLKLKAVLDDDLRAITRTGMKGSQDQIGLKGIMCMLEHKENGAGKIYLAMRCSKKISLEVLSNKVIAGSVEKIKNLVDNDEEIPLQISMEGVRVPLKDILQLEGASRYNFPLPKNLPIKISCNNELLFSAFAVGENREIAIEIA